MSSNNPNPIVRSAERVDPQAGQASSTPGSVVSEDDWKALSSDEVRDWASKGEYSDCDDSERELFENPKYLGLPGVVAPIRGDDFERRIRDDNENVKSQSEWEAGRARDCEMLEEERKEVEKEEEKYDPALPEHSNSAVIPPAFKEKMEQFRLSPKTRTVLRGNTSRQEHESTACSGFGRASGERLGESNGPAWRRSPSLGDRRRMVRSVEDCNVRATDFGRTSSEHVREGTEREMREEKIRGQNWGRQEREEGAVLAKTAGLGRGKPVDQFESKKERSTGLMLETTVSTTSTTMVGMAHSRGQETEGPLRPGAGYKPAALVEFFRQSRDRSISDEHSDCEHDDSDTESGIGSSRFAGSETEAGLFPEQIEAGIYANNQDREQGANLRSLGASNPHISSDDYILERIRKGMTTSREISGSQSSGFGRAGTSSDGAGHEGLSSTAKKVSEASINLEDSEWRESALQKASRLARERTESYHTPLYMRREDFGMLVPLRGLAESREVPVYERPGAIRGGDKEEYERWKIKEEAEETKMRKKAAERKATSRYASSFAQRRATQFAASRTAQAGIAAVDVGDVSNVVDSTAKDVKQDKGKGKVVEHEGPARGPPSTAMSINTWAERSFDEVWGELCAESGWDEDDETQKNMYQELVGKMSENYARRSSNISGENVGSSTAARVTKSREGEEEWIGQNRRLGIQPWVCSYGSTESREVIDERTSGFGRSRQMASKSHVMALSERRGGREVDTQLARRIDTTLRQTFAERHFFEASDNGPVSPESRTTEAERGIEKELRERLSNVERGSATSRENALHRKYEEEHARLSRLEREELLARMEQELKQEKEQNLREMLEIERHNIRWKAMRNGSTASREGAMRRKYEAEKAQLERLKAEQRDARSEYTTMKLRAVRRTRCWECRNRQLDCDGVMPSCSICKRIDRDCIYDLGRPASSIACGRVEKPGVRVERTAEVSECQRELTTSTPDRREEALQWRHEYAKIMLARRGEELEKELNQEAMWAQQEAADARSGTRDEVEDTVDREMENHSGTPEPRDAKRSESLAEDQSDGFKDDMDLQDIFRGMTVSGEQPFHTQKAEGEQLGISSSGIARSGMTESREPPRWYDANKERGRSTIGMTSSEKMPMRGGNHAATMNDHDEMLDGDDEEEDAEVNLEGLVLRTRIQVPEAMRRAMEKDEEWRGFA